MQARGVSVLMTEEKETKNKLRFVEQVEDGEEPVLELVYVPKATIQELTRGVMLTPRDAPIKIRVTVEVLYP